MKFKAGILALSIAVSNSANADDVFDSVQIDIKNCNLVKSGTNNKDILFSGQSTFGHCHITVPINDFNEQYSFCTLSGVISSKGNILCEFGYSDEKHSKVHFSSGPYVLCEFLCVKR